MKLPTHGIEPFFFLHMGISGKEKHSRRLKSQFLSRVHCQGRWHGLCDLMAMERTPR